MFSSKLSWAQGAIAVGWGELTLLEHLLADGAEGDGEVLEEVVDHVDEVGGVLVSPERWWLRSKS